MIRIGKSDKELYKFADSQKHDHAVNFDKKWVKGSMPIMSELFLYNNKLELNDHPEADLLHEVCPSLNRACKDKEVKVFPVKEQLQLLLSSEMKR